MINPKYKQLSGLRFVGFYDPFKVEYTFPLNFDYKTITFKFCKVLVSRIKIYPIVLTALVNNLLDNRKLYPVVGNAIKFNMNVFNGVSNFNTCDRIFVYNI